MFNILRHTLFLFCLSFLPQSLFAAKDTLTLNLKNADIRAVISTVSKVTGRNFIIDPRVKGKVTVISTTAQKPKAIYNTFLAILKVHGYAAIENQGATEIIPINRARNSSIPLTDHPERTQENSIITHVLPIEHVSASQLVPILRPLIPQHGHLAAYTPTNILILSDTTANIRRIRKIINRLDTIQDNEVDIIGLNHASSAEIARILTTLHQVDKKHASPSNSVKIISDARTNSIILSGAKTPRLKLKGLVAQLDMPLEDTASGNTQVIYLKYAKAKDLVSILTGMEANKKKNSKKDKKSPASQGSTFITADENTNALVITAPPDLFRSLLAVIHKLDIRRAQVLIEAIIAEVDVDKNREFGVQWGGFPSDGRGLPFLSTSDSDVNLAQLGGLIATGSAPTSIPSGLVTGLGHISKGHYSFAGLVKALSNDSTANILSTPSIVTLDNQEAEIIVGQNVPFRTGSYTNGTTPNPFTTIKREDVGLTLKVNPQINEGNAIQLEISQETSTVTSSVEGGADLITNKRSINTHVLVDDGGIIVLGGLIEEAVNEKVQKVPFLGDIPWLGALFQYKNLTKSKKNLMVFIHPKILRDAATTTHISHHKYSFLRAQQYRIKSQGIPLLPDRYQPVLDPLDKLFDRLPQAYQKPTLVLPSP